MSDAHPPPPDRGPAHSGGLIFDPNAPEPDGGGSGGWDGGGGGSKLPAIAGVAVAVVIAAVFGFALARGAAPAASPEDSSAVALPAPVSAPRIVAVPDSFISATVGDTVPFVWLVTTADGVPIPDTLVRVRLEDGPGTLLDDELRTDSTGAVRSALVLGAQPARVRLVASLAVGPSTGGRLEVDARAGMPTAIRAVSGDRQEALMGDLLPDRLWVEVTDDAGNPVYNAEIRFTVEMGEGLAAPTLTRTDSLGRASALWRLGRMVGAQRLSATATDAGTNVLFSASAVARPSEGTAEGPLEASAVTVRRSDFAIGGSHVCRLREGTVSCRGGNDRGQTESTEGNAAVQAITAGAAHTCALDRTGVASCWGGNERGQLGDGSRTDRSQPTRVRTELRFSKLVAGSAHTCGLAGGGVPFCWGLNLNGQLGDGSRNDQTTPRTVGSGLTFVDLASGWNHTCGLTSNGNAFCWGLNNDGQLGDGSRLDHLVPTLVRGSVQTLVAGSAHTCGISEGQVLCWGSNAMGQVGDGTREDRSAPTPVTGLPGRPTALAAGAVHACALVAGGAAYCWGQNLSGQLGDGTTENRVRAVAVAGGLSFAEIYAGGALTCGLTTGGVEYCWGLNQSGHLGDGSRMSRSTPVRIGG